MSISIRFNDQSIKKIINECKSWYVFLSIYVFPIFIYYLDKDSKQRLFHKFSACTEFQSSLIHIHSAICIQFVFNNSQFKELNIKFETDSISWILKLWFNHSNNSEPVETWERERRELYNFLYVVPSLNLLEKFSLFLFRFLDY